jgi:hypothetical protein
MCFVGLVLCLEPIAVSAIVARGFVGLEVRRQAVYLAMLMVLVPLGSRWGIVGVAWAVLAAAAIFLIMLQVLLRRLIGVSAKETLRAVAPAIAGCGTMSLAIATLNQLVRTRLAPDAPGLLLAAVPLGVVTYALTLTLLRRRSSDSVAREVLTELESFVLGAIRRVVKFR